MKKYKIKVRDTEWFLFLESNTWVTVKYMRSAGLSRTQIRAKDLGSALQYIYSTQNGSIEPLRVEDLIEIDEIQF